MIAIQQPLAPELRTCFFIQQAKPVLQGTLMLIQNIFSLREKFTLTIACRGDDNFLQRTPYIKIVEQTEGGS